MPVTKIEIPDYSLFDRLMSGFVHTLFGSLFVLGCLVTYGASWTCLGFAALLVWG